MPGKSLIQLLHEYATEPDADCRARNRAAFMEHREEIFKALGSGWSMRRIWDALRRDGRIAFSYSAFARFVQKARKGDAQP